MEKIIIAKYKEFKQFLRIL